MCAVTLLQFWGKDPSAMLLADAGSWKSCEHTDRFRNKGRAMTVLLPLLTAA